jgi:phosphopantothenoylcysteine decarboxylase
MWRHPVTAKQIRVLAEDWGVKDAAVDGEAGEQKEQAQEGWFQVIRVRISSPLLSLCKMC